MRINFRGGWKEAVLLVLALLIFLTVLLMPLFCAIAGGNTADAPALVKPALIRMHVVAHSDSPADQAVKLRVRDAVLARHGQVLSHAAESGADALMDALHAHVEEMGEAARQAARQAGFHGSVQAEAGWMCLPEKRMGDMVMPEGFYHALKITIGDGKGQNWWCVLYPDLALALCEQPGMEKQPVFHWNAGEILRHWLLIGK